MRYLKQIVVVLLLLSSLTSCGLYFEWIGLAQSDDSKRRFYLTSSGVQYWLKNAKSAVAETDYRVVAVFLKGRLKTEGKRKGHFRGRCVFFPSDNGDEKWLGFVDEGKEALNADEDLGDVVVEAKIMILERRGESKASSYKNYVIAPETPIRKWVPSGEPLKLDETNKQLVLCSVMVLETNRAHLLKHTPSEPMVVRPTSWRE